MGVTNDATIYHGQIHLTMNAPEIKDYLEKIPSSKSKGYGKPFNDIFKEASTTSTRSTPRSSLLLRSSSTSSLTGASTMSAPLMTM